MFQCLTLLVCKSGLLNQSELSNKIITTIRVVVALTPHRSNSVAELRPLHPQQSCCTAETTHNLDPPTVEIVRLTPTVEMKGLTPTVEMKGLTLCGESGIEGATKVK